jgi:hypothetical protein
VREYERVKLALKNGIAAEQIALMTGMQPTVVRAYLKLLTHYQPDLAVNLPVPAAPSGKQGR